jgi:hypothetical protein
MLAGCSSKNGDEKQIIDADKQLAIDLKMYHQVWTSYLSGDTTVMSEEYFTKDVVIVTDEGDLVGLDKCKEYYSNYLTGFTEIKWTIIDAFGQGDKLVKHWNFKGKHTGMFFGIAPTGNDLDLSGTTIVTLVDGKIAKEHDFFDMKSMIDQLTKSDGELIIDEYQPIN